MAKEIEPELSTDGKPITTEDAFPTTLKFPSTAEDYNQMMKSPSPSPVQMQGNAKDYFTGGGGGRVISSPAMSGGGGERDDGYFDAHPWFDSDTEEFRSVNGDFGSSRSFTPIINRIDSEPDFDTSQQTTPHVLNRSSTGSNTTGYPNNNVRPSASRSSSSSVKKQLIEFFSESFSRDLRTEIEEESISKQPLERSFHNHKHSSSSTSNSDRSISSPGRESILSKPIFGDGQRTTTTTATNKKSTVKSSCILLVRSLSCGGGGGGNVADGGKKKRSRRHGFKQ